MNMHVIYCESHAVIISVLDLLMNQNRLIYYALSLLQYEEEGGTPHATIISQGMLSYSALENTS